jgi:hypothetical protein
LSSIVRTVLRFGKRATPPRWPCPATLVAFAVGDGHCRRNAIRAGTRQSPGTLDDCTVRFVGSRSDGSAQPPCHHLTLPIPHPPATTSLHRHLRPNSVQQTQDHLHPAGINGDDDLTFLIPRASGIERSPKYDNTMSELGDPSVNLNHYPPSPARDQAAMSPIATTPGGIVATRDPPLTLKARLRA